MPLETNVKCVMLPPNKAKHIPQNDLMKALSLKQPNVTLGLKVLKDAGIVKIGRGKSDKRKRTYRLVPVWTE